MNLSELHCSLCEIEKREQVGGTYIVVCLDDDCGAILADETEATPYVAALEAELAQAMDALFPNGWGQDDAEELGSIVEGVCDTMTADVAELAQSRADNARLRGALALGYSIQGGGTPGSWWLGWARHVKSLLPEEMFERGGPIWTEDGESVAWTDFRGALAALEAKDDAN